MSLPKSLNRCYLAFIKPKISCLRTPQDKYKKFLYDLASRIDGAHFLIDDNQRGITSRIVQLFIKHVFIKHALQGINFCAWDADDLEGLQVSMPDELILRLKRKLSVVELNNLYFLIALWIHLMKTAIL